LGFRVWDVGFRVSGLGFREYPDGEVFDILGIHHLLLDQLLRQDLQHTLPFRIQSFGLRVSDSEFRVLGSGFRVQGFGFRISSLV